MFRNQKIFYSLFFSICTLLTTSLINAQSKVVCNENKINIPVRSITWSDDANHVAVMWQDGFASTSLFDINTKHSYIRTSDRYNLIEYTDYYQIRDFVGAYSNFLINREDTHRAPHNDLSIMTSSKRPEEYWICSSNPLEAGIIYKKMPQSITSVKWHPFLNQVAIAAGSTLQILTINSFNDIETTQTIDFSGEIDEISDIQWLPLGEPEIKQEQNTEVQAKLVIEESIAYAAQEHDDSSFSGIVPDSVLDGAARYLIVKAKDYHVVKAKVNIDREPSLKIVDRVTASALPLGSKGESQFCVLHDEESMHGHEIIVAPNGSQQIEIWNPILKRCVAKCDRSLEGNITTMVVSPDKRQIALGLDNGKIEIINRDDFEPTFSLKERRNRELTGKMPSRRDLRLKPDLRKKLVFTPKTPKSMEYLKSSGSIKKLKVVSASRSEASEALVAPVAHESKRSGRLKPQVLFLED